MEKQLKSYTGVLLRANLTGHGHPTYFGRHLLINYWLKWPCPVKSALKRTPVQDFKSYSIMFNNIISNTNQKIGDLFCPPPPPPPHPIVSCGHFTFWNQSLGCS